MNNEVKISNFNQLLDEKRRLEELIHKQKSIVRHNLDELRIEFRHELKPALDAGKIIRNIIAPRKNNSVFAIATTLAVRITATMVAGRSKGIFKILIPALLEGIRPIIIRHFSPPLRL